MYYRFGKVFYFFSILLFLLTLLFWYAALPAMVGFQVDELGTVIQEFEKSSFFYTMAATFLILNLLVMYLPKSLETKANRKLHRFFPLGDPFRDYLLLWFYSFGGWVNLGLVLTGLFVHVINKQDDLGIEAYRLWFFLLPLVLMSWIIGLFVLLVKKFKTAQQAS